MLLIKLVSMCFELHKHKYCPFQFSLLTNPQENRLKNISNLARLRKT